MDSINVYNEISIVVNGEVDEKMSRREDKLIKDWDSLIKNSKEADYELSKMVDSLTKKIEDNKKKNFPTDKIEAELNELLKYKANRNKKLKKALLPVKILCGVIVVLLAVTVIYLSIIFFKL